MPLLPALQASPGEAGVLGSRGGACPTGAFLPGGGILPASYSPQRVAGIEPGVARRGWGIGARVTLLLLLRSSGPVAFRIIRS